MTNTYEILDGDLVVNTVLATEEFVAEHYAGSYRLLVVPAPEIPPVVEDPKLWYMDVGPFVDRFQTFGNQKLAILTSEDTVVKALMLDMSWRKYIDLKRTDLAQMLDLLISKGFAVDKNAILTTRTTEAERHIKGLPEIWV